jgi:hypothetical protein
MNNINNIIIQAKWLAKKNSELAELLKQYEENKLLKKPIRKFWLKIKDRVKNILKLNKKEYAI